MRNLILLVGPPGSGKSTLAQKFVGQGYVYVNQDSQGKEKHLELFNVALAENQDIVVDRLNFSKVQRDRYLKPSKEAGYYTEIIVLHESYDTCLQRCLNRENHETIKNEESAKAALHMFFTKYERVQDEEADVVDRVWPKGEKQDAIWLDMDNTLSDATHREYHLQGEKKNWKGFFEDMDKDPVNDWCRMLAIGMKGCSNVLVCSARPNEYRNKTVSWLEFNDVPYDELIMRYSGDYRKDSIIKLIMYEFEVKTRYRLLFSVDDRKQVIDEMRKYGVTVLDCAGEKGNF